jgi:hypothetical protein
MVFISGCTGLKVYSNIPKGTKRLPEGYGLVYGSVSTDTCIGNESDRINYLKMVILHRGKRIEQVTSTCQERITFAPTDLFQFMVPAGKIDLEIQMHDPIYAIEREFGRVYTSTTYYYKPGIYTFKTSYNIPPNTAVYIGDLRYVRTFLDGQRANIKIRVYNIMRSYQAVPKSVRGSFDDAAKHHKSFFDKNELVCDSNRTSLNPLTPINYIIGSSGKRDFISIPDGNTDKSAGDQK